MIAPLFKIGDLRECNVVLNSNISAKREACPGLPAVYLLEPTLENYKAIAADCQNALYDFAFVNFTRKLNDSELDRFAIEMTRVNGAERIARVSYEHLGAYHCVNRDFFSFSGHQANFINFY